MKQVDAELDEVDSDAMNEDEFNQHAVGGELDLPSEEGDQDAEDSDEQMASDSESDGNLDDYCKELGIDPALLKDEKQKPSKESVKEKSDTKH